MCEKCETSVKGNGYTNHCPTCLYSKHVDNNPGDRASVCGGLMAPIKIEGTQKEYVVTHKCATCNHEKRNKLSESDSMDVATQVIRKSIK